MNTPLILHCCANTKKISFVFLESPIIFVFLFGHFGKPNNICIRIWSFLGSQIIFVFVFGHFWNSNNIRIRIRSSKHYSLTSVKVLRFDQRRKDFTLALVNLLVTNSTASQLQPWQHIYCWGGQK